MKKTIISLVLLAFIGVLSVNLSSCKKDDPVPPAVKTALNTAITQSETLLASAVEGRLIGNYTVGAKALFQTVLDAAKLVAANADVTQAVVDAATANLAAAKTVFEDKQIQNVSTDGLVAQWLFDGDATDFTGNGNNGTAMAGNAAFGAGTPSLTTDRFGNTDKAYFFNEGAFINVPYTSALNPTKISIALWVNATEIRENNRFMGLQSWNGYKFQLQSVNKAFFTAATTESIYDKDTDPELDIDTWYHLVVTYESGSMTFYVDGVQKQQYTDATGDLVTVNGHDLAIGVGSSKYADTDANYGDDTHADYQVIPTAWGGYFHGSLDDIRLYNRVLTTAEVASIYELERP